MTKTIEEAAREAIRKEYFCESCAYKGDCDLCGGQNTAFDCCECPADSYEDGFKTGATHVLSQPLSQRLTDEERERIKANYADAKDIHARCVGTMCKNHIADLHNEYNKGLNMGIIIALKHIFGKELFGEDKKI